MSSGAQHGLHEVKPMRSRRTPTPPHSPATLQRSSKIPRGGLKDSKLEALAKDGEEFKAEKWDDVPELGSVNLENEDLKTVIVQLRALGLITHAERKRSTRDSTPYWTLTRLGDQTTRLRAIRKRKRKKRNKDWKKQQRLEGTIPM